MANNYYTPFSDPLELAVGNLAFYQSFLEDFSPSTSLATLWPGQQIQSIIISLKDVAGTTVLVMEYMKLYKKLTTSNFSI